MKDQLLLHTPVTPFRTTQRFGENLACIDIATHTTCIARVGGDVCPSGFEPLYRYQGLRGHNGLDLAAEHKQPVYAATDAIVYRVMAERERGVGVELISTERYLFKQRTRPYRMKTRYWHLLAYGVHKGQKVKAGQLIGWADNTGLSAGNHLHMELKPVRRSWRWRWVNVLQDNGYFGAIDPEPYFIDHGVR